METANGTAAMIETEYDYARMCGRCQGWLGVLETQKRVEGFDDHADHIQGCIEFIQHLWETQLRAQAVAQAEAETVTLPEVSDHAQ